ncbi:hypothetical protein Y032_0004g1916 [Ancylostoma ceylanicum]|uniref:Uncharacterized protein n=1 Tax=Ancylostoma ceylanicum TaxID=53326 RepID=A0A016VWE5_9BILA|nr:hypothetical protein Y032_0004g1916 [Ancylostoma ceylanicum]
MYGGLHTVVAEDRDRGTAFLCVSVQQARYFGAPDKQGARAAVPTLVYDRFEFTVFQLLSVLPAPSVEF